MDNNFEGRLIRGQAQEIDQVVQRLERLHMYGDDRDEPKGELVNYAFMSIADFEPHVLNKLVLMVFVCKLLVKR